MAEEDFLDEIERERGTLAMGRRVRVTCGDFEGRAGEIVEPLDEFGRYGVHLGRTRQLPRNGGRKAWPYWFAPTMLEVVPAQPEGDE